MARLLLILPLMFGSSVANQLDRDWPSKFRYVPIPALNTITAPNAPQEYTSALLDRCGSFYTSLVTLDLGITVWSIGFAGPVRRAASQCGPWPKI